MNMASDSGIRVASAISTAGQAARAVDQVCADVVEQLKTAPDLALLFVSSQYAPVDEQLARQACRLLGTEQLIGGTGESIVGVGVEIEERPAVSLWAARLDGVAILPMHLRLERAADGASIVGWPERLSSDWPADATMLVIGEPFSFPADLMVERLNEDHRDLRGV
ncbi:MAG: hypothetical protein FJ276_37075, partial [Planctomycetes bacterium]|nr:hypothetical protein [Planctomycetota bacterium]